MTGFFATEASAFAEASIFAEATMDKSADRLRHKEESATEYTEDTEIQEL